jgi:hypothetical protein
VPDSRKVLFSEDSSRANRGLATATPIIADGSFSTEQRCLRDVRSFAPIATLYLGSSCNSMATKGSVHLSSPAKFKLTHCQASRMSRLEGPQWVIVTVSRLA